MDLNKKDVLEDKVFTKTAFAVRIDVLEAGIKYEREQRAEKDKQIMDMARQFQLLSMSLSKLGAVSDDEAASFWKTLLLYMPKEFSEKLTCLNEGSKLSQTFVNGLIQALKVYGISRIGEIKDGKAKA